MTAVLVRAGGVTSGCQLALLTHLTSLTGRGCSCHTYKDELSVWVGGAEAAHRPPTGPGVGGTAAARSSRHPPLTTTGMFQTRTQKTRGNRYIMFTRNMKLSLYTTAYRLTEESQE
ncbi:hypothetical protein Pmani_033555 [Petrolisthes manimaculis]|uniref:Uncharacterized protein n=1 Tax=Petrolisthes manimaculis TaxID=1843537 RepID=A0AAE1NP66_9EUCA|nr:hypothetical protein Pmani_033555 [Petrolisthes manimaculis]